MIPELSLSVIENIEMFDEQANMNSQKARNLNSDVYKLINEFRDQVEDKTTVNYVFWEVLKLYVEIDYTRRSIIEHLLEKFIPYYFYVYQLIKDGEVIYVGKSDRLNYRLSEHRATGKEFDDVKVYLCTDEREQEVIENTTIIRLWPPLNKYVRLDLADKNLELPEFKTITEVEPDFILRNNIDVRFNIGDNYHLIPDVGFVHKRTIPKPRWK